MHMTETEKHIQSQYFKLEVEHLLLKFQKYERQIRENATGHITWA